MSYATKNKRNMIGSIAAVIVLAVISMWQFYLFANFDGHENAVASGSGSAHLWWAIAMAVFACIAGVMVFSVFLRYDSDDELHITASPQSRRVR